MRLGYNSNGFAFHRWSDALELLADLGYESVAITVDHHWLDPFGPDFAAELRATKQALDRLGLRSVVETGARFLLNPRAKHEPTLVSATPEERDVRVDFLVRCIDIAAELGSEAVSFWAGVVHDGALSETSWSRLVDGCRRVTEHAERRDVRLAFEPEPGMLIETMADFERLHAAINHPLFGLTIDVGHLQCVEDPPIDQYLRDWSTRLFNVHIEDMVRGVHEHLRFGEGEIDFDAVLRALVETRYEGGLHVELGRDGHAAPDVMRESFHFLNERLKRLNGKG